MDQNRSYEIYQEGIELFRGKKFYSAATALSKAALIFEQELGSKHLATLSAYKNAGIAWYMYRAENDFSSEKNTLEISSKDTEDEAIALLQKYISLSKESGRIDEQTALAMCYLARQYFFCNHYLDAILTYEEAIEWFSSHDASPSLLGKLYYRTAEACSLLKQHGKAATYHTLSMNAYAKAGKNYMEDALIAAEKAIDIYCGFSGGIGKHSDEKAIAVYRRIREIAKEANYKDWYIWPKRWSYVDDMTKEADANTTTISIPTRQMFNKHNNTIRVFISSTFQDMEQERNVLLETFREINLKFMERNVSVTALDLRWGVTEEESKTGKVVEVCLNEIDNSHPFFIGIIGNRYGWCPPIAQFDGNSNLVERYEQLRNLFEEGLSVTEIEMQYGALMSQEDTSALFFIKKGGGDDIQGTEAVKLEKLKEKIRNNGRFPIYEYTDANELRNIIYKEFSTLLDNLYPFTELSPVDRERQLQYSYLESRLHGYVQIPEMNEAINDFMNDDKKHYLTIYGETGMGKSALMANWIRQHEKDISRNIVFHFVGHGYGDTTTKNILKKISDEIRQMYELPSIQESVNDDAWDETSDVLLQIKGGKPLLIVIDGINNIEEYGKSMRWLPKLPHGVKIILTTTSNDETLDSCMKLMNTIELKPLNHEQKVTLVQQKLRIYGKKLDLDQTDRIIADKENENTFVLCTLLDELISFGDYMRLNRRIDYYLNAPDIKNFFTRVVRRQENEYGNKMVTMVLSALTLTKNGLTETDLIGLSGARQLEWSSFFCSFMNFLVTKSGFITIANEVVKEAIIDRYMPKDDAKNYYRKIIIEWITSHPSEYLQNELLYQYYNIGDADMLINYLKSVEMPQKLDAELRKLSWEFLITQDSVKYSPIKIIETEDQKTTLEKMRFLYSAASSLQWAKEYDWAEVIYDRLLQIGDEEISNFEEMLKPYKENHFLKFQERKEWYSLISEYSWIRSIIKDAKQEQGIIKYHRGAYSEAKELWDEDDNSYNNDYHDLAIKTYFRGMMFLNNGDYDNARNQFLEVENYSVMCNNVEDAATARFWYGMSYAYEKQHVCALKYYEEAKAYIQRNELKYDVGFIDKEIASSYLSLAFNAKIEKDNKMCIKYLIKVEPFIGIIRDEEKKIFEFLAGDLGNYYFDNGNAEKALNYYECKAKYDRENLSIDNYNAMLWEFFISICHQALGHHQEAIDNMLYYLNHSSTDPQNDIEAFELLAEEYFNLNSDDLDSQTAKYARLCLDYYKKVNETDHLKLWNTYSRLMFSARGDEAIDAANKVENMANTFEEIDEKTRCIAIGESYRMRAVNHKECGEFDKAKEQYLLAKDYFVKAGDKERADSVETKLAQMV